MKVRRYQLANDIGISAGGFSEVLNGKRRVTIPMSQAFGDYTNIRWVEFLDMDPDEIERLLIDAYAKRHCDCAA